MFEQVFRNIDDVLWKEAGCTTELDGKPFTPNVTDGVEQLDTENLKGLLELKYGSTYDTAARLGSVRDIRQNFIGFQRGLYESGRDTK